MAIVLAAESETEFVMAARHVVQGRRIVAEQHQRIARLKAQGSCTRDYETTLTIFVGTLQIFEEHERTLRASAEKLATERGPASSPKDVAAAARLEDRLPGPFEKGWRKLP